jgi:hypothetical protein
VKLVAAKQELNRASQRLGQRMRSSSSLSGSKLPETEVHGLDNGKFHHRASHHNPLGRLHDKDAASMIITCTYHCSTCGQHFHSLAAFDRHRVGSLDASIPVGSEHGRRCLHPLDVQRANGEAYFEPLTTSGECRMYDDGAQTNVEHGVTVWALSKTAAQRRWLASVH